MGGTLLDMVEYMNKEVFNGTLGCEQTRSNN